jgi:hypothetical protein
MTGWKAGTWILAALLIPVIVALTATQADASPRCRRHGCASYDRPRAPEGERAGKATTTVSAKGGGAAAPPQGRRDRHASTPLEPSPSLEPAHNDSQRGPQRTPRESDRRRGPTLEASRPNPEPTRSARRGERRHQRPTGETAAPDQPRENNQPADVAVNTRPSNTGTSRNRDRSGSPPERAASTRNHPAGHRQHCRVEHIDASTAQPASAHQRIPPSNDAAVRPRQTHDVERPTFVPVRQHPQTPATRAVHVTRRPPARSIGTTPAARPIVVIRNADSTDVQHSAPWPVGHSTMQPRPSLGPISPPMPPLIVPSAPRPIHTATPRPVTTGRPTPPRQVSPPTSPHSTPSSKPTLPTTPAPAARPAVDPAPASSTTLAVMLVSLALAVAMVVAVAGWRGGRRDR